MLYGTNDGYVHLAAIKNNITCWKFQGEEIKIKPLRGNFKNLKKITTLDCRCITDQNEIYFTEDEKIFLKLSCRPAKISGMTNDNNDISSSRLFCSGVPVNSRRRLAYKYIYIRHSFCNCRSLEIWQLRRCSPFKKILILSLRWFVLLESAAGPCQTVAICRHFQTASENTSIWTVVLYIINYN